MPCSECRPSIRPPLGRLIQDSGIGGSYHLRYLRGVGWPGIPNFVEANAVDLLVMGTLARSGILGFFIGNTAEEYYGKTGLFVAGTQTRRAFVSPVKTY